jgi:predicted transcriptional regulator
MSRDPTDDDPVMLSFRVPRGLKRRLEAMTAASGVAMQEIARQALESELELREEVLDEQRATFARLAAEENERRLVKRARRRSDLHADPKTR